MAQPGALQDPLASLLKAADSWTELWAPSPQPSGEESEFLHTQGAREPATNLSSEQLPLVKVLAFRDAWVKAGPGSLMGRH